MESPLSRQDPVTSGPQRASALSREWGREGRGGDYPLRYVPPRRAGKSEILALPSATGGGGRGGLARNGNQTIRAAAAAWAAQGSSESLVPAALAVGEMPSHWRLAAERVAGKDEAVPSPIMF